MKQRALHYQDVRVSGTERMRRLEGSEPSRMIPGFPTRARKKKGAVRGVSREGAKGGRRVWRAHLKFERLAACLAKKSSQLSGYQRTSARTSEIRCGLTSPLITEPKIVSRAGLAFDGGLKDHSTGCRGSLQLTPPPYRGGI